MAVSYVGGADLHHLSRVAALNKNRPVAYWAEGQRYVVFVDVALVVVKF